MEKDIRLAIVILAAGLSRRMGTIDKLLMEFAGEPLFARALSLAAQLPHAFCVVVTNNCRIRAGAVEAGFVTAVNPLAPTGIASSIASGVRELPGAYDTILFLNADQPLLRLQTVQRLLEEARRSDRIIVPCYMNQPQSPCLFPRRFYHELADIRGDKGGRQVYQHHLSETCFVDFKEPEDFWDIDTKADQEKILHFRGGR